MLLAYNCGKFKYKACILVINFCYCFVTKFGILNIKNQHSQCSLNSYTSVQECSEAGWMMIFNFALADVGLYMPWI